MIRRSLVLTLVLGALFALGGFTVVRDSHRAASVRQDVTPATTEQAKQSVDMAFDFAFARVEQKLTNVETDLQRRAGNRPATDLAVQPVQYSPAIYYADRYGGAFTPATRRGNHVGKL